MDLEKPQQLSCDSDDYTRAADFLPRRVWLVMVIGAVERFAYFGLTTPFQNYMQFGVGDSPTTGALGFGQTHAIMIWYIFQFYITIAAVSCAVIADEFLGRYCTLCYCAGSYVVGTAILLATSFVNLQSHNICKVGFMISLVFLGPGIGGFRCNLSAFLGDQCDVPKEQVRVTADGKKIVVDREMTMQRIYNINYWLTNIGSLSSLATTFLEKKIGFWASFSLPCAILGIAPLSLFIGRSHYVRIVPQKSVLLTSLKMIYWNIRNRIIFKNANFKHFHTCPRNQVSLDHSLIHDLRIVLKTSRVLLSLCIAWLCLDQLSNNLIAQASQMETNGIPNDVLLNANPISVIVILPLFQQILYPQISRHNINFGPVARICAGFVLLSLSMGYTAVVQALIYSRKPCFDRPLECANAIGPNQINVWIQLPTYIIQAPAEILAIVSATEYAYNEAPLGMKSIVQAINSLAGAGGALLGLAISPLARNPKLVGLYSGLAGTMLATAMLFGVCFRRVDCKREAR